MPLVDYGSSEESSDEEQEKKCEATLAENKDVKVTGPGNGEKSIFSSLPKPKEHVSLDGKDQFKNLLLKGIKIEGGNKREPARITVPSLNDFNDDDDDDTSKPKPKKIKPSGNGVGLFAVLPPPKNSFLKPANRTTTSIIPKSQLTQPKMKVSTVTTIVHKGRSSNFAYFKSHANVAADSDDNETPASSYFGEGITNSNQNILNEYDNATPFVPTNQEHHAPLTPDEEGTVNIPESYETSLANNVDANPDADCKDLQPSDGTLELDEKALQILCGGKRKRNQMPVNIIDLSGEEIMPDSKEWLLKQLTEEKNVTKSSQKTSSNGPSLQSRRKHQITYLAYQAKAQELELQNQWSINKMSRRQTQSKYGF